MSKLEVARNGMSTFEDFSNDMERIFDSIIGRTVGGMLRSGNNEKFMPSLDVSETAEAFEIALDLPGVKAEDLKVEMQEGRLVIAGQRSSALEQKEKTFHRVERSHGSFQRVIALPTDVDVEQIDAKYEHGVLHVCLPKSAKQQPKKIEIRTAS